MTRMEKAQDLGKRAIANPKLIEALDEDTFLKFVIALSIHDRQLASRVFDLRYDLSAQTKVLFWEAVGIIAPIEDCI